jgi:hypothetical protein
VDLRFPCTDILFLHKFPRAFHSIHELGHTIRLARVLKQTAVSPKGYLVRTQLVAEEADEHSTRNRIVSGQAGGLSTVQAESHLRGSCHAPVEPGGVPEP